MGNPKRLLGFSRSSRLRSRLCQLLEGRTETSTQQLLRWIGLYESTFYKWSRSYGKEYQHNGAIPRDHWLEDWERDAIVNFHFEHPLDGYRRLTYMMLDADIVAVSPATV